MIKRDHLIVNRPFYHGNDIHVKQIIQMSSNSMIKIKISCSRMVNNSSELRGNREGLLCTISCTIEKTTKKCLFLLHILTYYDFKRC